MEGMELMNRQIQLLDCTLRDGGYINDWEFGHNRILNLYERIVAASIDIVEVGFIDERRPFDYNRAIYPDTSSIKETFVMTGSRPPMLVGMIDYGTCSLQHIEPAKDSILDGIRVIFKKHRMHEAIEYCGEIKKLGYDVFVQLVAVSSYTDDDIYEVAELVNGIAPYAVSMVDTYGLLYPEQLIHYYELLNKLVLPNIKIGFHAHNNLQLAFANALAFVNRPTDRDIVVDGTLYGMGKSAGNAPLEMLAPYLNQNYDRKYDTDSLLEGIEDSIKDIYSRSPWGYKTQFYLSAEYACHPNYVSILLKKDDLSVSDISRILDELPDDDSRILYNREIIEKLYADYLRKNYNDSERALTLSKQLCGRKILIIGPGKNIKLQSDKVKSFIELNAPIIISINYIPDDIIPDFAFVSKKSRYQEMTTHLKSIDISGKEIGLIVTSGVEPLEKTPYVFDRTPLLEKKEEIIDNSFIMLLKILNMANVSEVYCAGLDGYSDTEDNYFREDMEYSFIKKVARQLNYHIKEVLLTELRDIKVNFVTYSHYDNVEDTNYGAY